jgi:organic radical activating enzyme
VKAVSQGSFTAASTLPAKLLQNLWVGTQVREGYIPPIHVQLNPTNRCNLKCGFCSCSGRDKKAELPLQAILEAMSRFASWGCRSVTITGGGEPLLHPDINALIRLLTIVWRIAVGLVTNGTQFHLLNTAADLTWCRISSSDDREPDWPGILNAIGEAPRVDWAFSHVLTRKPDWERLCRLVSFANEHNFTHVRIVGDLLDIKEAASCVREAKDFLKGQGIDDRLVIYQDRAEYVAGRKKCGISLLKPVLGADGGIYPCCGVQYAQDPPGRDLVASMRMGEWEDIDRIWSAQRAFDGSVCTRCYYDPYNVALDLMATPLCHAEFI